MRPSRVRLIMAAGLLVAIMLALVGCGGDGSSSSGDTLT